MELLLLILIVLGIAWQRKTSRRLARIEDELTALKAQLGTAPMSASVAVADSPNDSPPAEQRAPASEAAAPKAIAPHAYPVLAKRPRPAPSDTLESRLGARWAVWVGGIALAFGGIFLIRYSIESGLLRPETRLALAAVFGLLLVAAGELIRRKALPAVTARYGNAMIPGALTAAGAVTLLAATYAAHGYYGFIGPTLAFALLGLISFATLALSLLHGQALAGLGITASLLTPALVASTAPSANVLFGFLAIVWLASAAAARQRGWLRLPILANLGLACWAVIYVLTSDTFDPLPPTLALLVMTAGTAFVWPGRTVAQPVDSTEESRFGFLRRRPLGIGLSVSLGILLSASAMLMAFDSAEVSPTFAAAALIAALAALGGGRSYAVWPTLLSAAGAVMVVGLLALIRLDSIAVVADAAEPVATVHTADIAICLLLGAVFTFLGFVFLKRFGQQERRLSVIWAVLMSAVPITLAVISFLNFGLLALDWTHGVYGVLLGAALLAGAFWQFRETEAGGSRRPANLLVLGSFAAFALALHALTNGLVTTVLLPVLGFAYVTATRQRSWSALPWAMSAALLVIFARIAWEPTLVGPGQLGQTPFLNALLPGYGIPALLSVLAAYQLRHWPDLRARNFLQALASLMVLMTAAVLVRHAMNGGSLAGGTPTLAEQSIYTLLTVGFSAALMTLDGKSPSPVFRYGSIIAGVISTINVLSLHVFGLNPYFSGESTGRWPFANLLLIGYLLPAIAYAGLAYYARDRRPAPYVAILAASGALLGFLWATLSVRRFWQGDNIADWKGFLAGETYTYSVVWLVIGVACLILGSRLDARSLRLASAGLVIITVIKVFLIDMSNLEGILRALSFIGLGVVLMGIGFFYQKILARSSSSSPSPSESNQS